MKQSFSANKVTISDQGEPPCVSFGEVEPNGSVRHSLIFTKDEEESGPRSIRLEFNDQGNSCPGSAIEAVELNRQGILVRLKESAPLRKGSVEGLEDAPLEELTARFNVSSAQYVELKDMLRGILAPGCGLGGRD